MSDSGSSTIQDIGETIQKGAGAVAKGTGETLKTMAKMAGQQVKVIKTLSPEEEAQKAKEKAETDAKIKSIQRELHDEALKMGLKTREQRQQEEQAKLQEEEALAQKKAAEEKEQQMNNVALPSSVAKGPSLFGQKKKSATPQLTNIQRAKTTTEANRGTTG